MRPRMLFERRPMSASSGKAERVKFWVFKSFNLETRFPGFDPRISRFDPCSPGQKSACTPETPPKPSKTAHSHTSPSRLQNERPHADQIAKNTWQPKCSKSERARSADSAAPRGTVRGKPAYATGGFPTLAPALVRRRPRRTSRRAKRPSPQPCRHRRSADDGQDPRRRRAEC